MLPRPTRITIFNNIFEVELASHGLPQGLKLTSFSAQYHERHKANSAPWQAVMRPSSSPEEDQLRAEVRAKIAAALAARNDSRGAPERSQEPRSPTTPPPSRVSRATSDSRKRLASSIRTPVAQDDSDDDDVPVSRQSKVARTAKVVVPVTPESERRASAAPAHSSLSRFQNRGTETARSLPSAASPATPTPNLARKQARPGATILYERPGRTSVYLKPHEYAETLPPLVNVIEDLGKPHLPPLLFRYFDEESHGVNSPDKPEGFICGQFKDAYVPVRPAPSCDDVEWNDLARHLDHSSNSSPFISTSNLLIWTIQNALKSAKRGATKGRISVIDTRRLSRSNVFWVPEFHTSLAKKKPFKKGGFNYRGSHEHLGQSFQFLAFSVSY